MAIRRYFSSAESIQNFLLDLRFRTVMLAVEYEDGLKRAMVQGAHMITIKLSDKLKDVVFYGIRKRHPYNPL